MKKFIIYIILAYFTLSVQTLFFESIKPDFILVLVCFYALRNDPLKGVTYGAFAGLLIDASNGFLIGPNIISKSFAAFMVKVIRENVFQWNIFASTLMVAVFSIVDMFIVSTCIKTFSNVSLTNRPWEISFWGFCYTVISAVLLYVVIKPDRDEMVLE